VAYRGNNAGDRLDLCAQLCLILDEFLYLRLLLRIYVDVGSHEISHGAKFALPNAGEDSGDKHHVEKTEGENKDHQHEHGFVPTRDGFVGDEYGG